MSETRQIRKYVNRRLYDTSQSRYVNLDDLRRLIIDGDSIQVRDQASGDDITASVLLQIIGESQRGREPLLQAEFLCDVVRLAARASDPALPGRLNRALRDAVKESASAAPAAQPAPAPSYAVGS